MNITSIKERIDKLGYFTYLTNGDLMISKKIGEMSDIPGGILLHHFGILSINANQIRIEYGPAAITFNKEFSSLQEAIDFIKKEFPL